MGLEKTVVILTKYLYRALPRARELDDEPTPCTQVGNVHAYMRVRAHTHKSNTTTKLIKIYNRCMLMLAKIFEELQPNLRLTKTVLKTIRTHMLRNSK